MWQCQGRGDASAPIEENRDNQTLERKKEPEAQNQQRNYRWKENKTWKGDIKLRKKQTC